ncbi:unnamed protein product [Durusdinium trenchii]|uniref:Integrase catalytic domain-containing protein n=1 Tax=Durusdinium trenchii TaxID=1381693 RepID=A0ABP0RRA1_9DINO
MGHPSNNDLARHLKLAGASEESVKACHQLHCQTCKRHARSGSRRPAKVFKPLDFNEEVAVDTMHLYDLSGNKVTVLSIMDVGSGYHVVAPVTGRKAEDYTQRFLKSWVAWAGAPQSTLVDQERGLMKDFPEELEKHGIRVNYTAGQAHWQNGHIERQNEWFRQIFDRVKDHLSTQDHEVEWVLASVSQAKNYLRRRHGYSPAQWLFGVAPRLGEGILDEEDDIAERQSEELGGTLQAKAVRSDLVKLIEGMEIDDEEVFADAGELAPVDAGGDLEYTPSLPDEGEPMEEEPNSGAKRPADTSVPERRMRQKGYCPMVPEPEDVPVPEDQELLCYMASEKRVPRALQKQDNQLFGLLATHVDDSSYARPQGSGTSTLGDLPDIDAWEEASTGLEYCGVTVKQEKNQVTLSQEHYVNTRLQTVDIPKGVLPEDPADEVAKMDNQSTIGALSWLASQTRPDIQVGVSMAQRKQRSPTYYNIKATNHVVRMAQKEKEEKLVYDKLGNWNDLVIIVYHDAACANVDYAETKDTGIYSQLGYVAVIARREVLLGKKPGQGIVATWKSHACCFRAGCPGELLTMTDCKSLYDSVHRAGGPRAPSEKRLLVDLAALRQMAQQEDGDGDLKNRLDELEALVDSTLERQAQGLRLKCEELDQRCKELETNSKWMGVTLNQEVTSRNAMVEVFEQMLKTEMAKVSSSVSDQIAVANLDSKETQKTVLDLLSKDSRILMLDVVAFFACAALAPWMNDAVQETFDRQEQARAINCDLASLGNGGSLKFTQQCCSRASEISKAWAIDWESLKELGMVYARRVIAPDYAP